MKLRRQLALVSLAALVLPWALIQYAQVFDSLVREAQIREMGATARAIAARLGADPALLERAGLSRRTGLGADRQIYLHRLPAPPVLDGFTGDWETYPVAPRRFNPPDGPAMALSAGRHGERITLLAEVEDPQVRYHRPGTDQLATGDHLVIYTRLPSVGPRYYVVRTGRPGAVQVVYRDLAGSIRRDYRISGFWRATPTGYRLELQLPARWRQYPFALAAVDRRDNTSRASGTLGELALIAGGPDAGVLPAASGRLVAADDELTAALEVFVRPGLTLTVTDRHRWQRARSGSLNPSDADKRPWWLDQLLAWPLERNHLPDYSARPTGREQGPGVQSAIEGSAAHHWYRDEQGTLARLAVPIYLDWQSAGAVESQLAGTVVLEQRNRPGEGLDGAALPRLIGITAGGGLILALALIGYASWLSWRIRRLSRAAQQAREDEGLAQALAHWPRGRVGDELDELSGHYHALLTRVRHYTHYLKTLTGKLSHELRTPLAVVKSSLDNLGHTALDDSAHTYTRRAREGAERLGSILDAMSEASRVEASIQTAEKETVDLAALVRDIAGVYDDLHPDLTVKARIEPAPAAYYRSRVAPELLVQMLDKLMDNAADFAPPGSELELSLQLEAGADGPKGYRLSLSNPGPGLPPELEGRLFDSLTSGRTRRDPAGKVHLGLGLYIVWLIVRYHAGRVEAHNRADPEGGVTVTVELPWQPPPVHAQRC